MVMLGAYTTFVVQDIIRDRIGFDGLLFTDDLDMEALSGTVPERARRAQQAGCDIALNCWAKMDDMTGIAERLTPMSDKTRQRLDRAMASIADVCVLPCQDILSLDSSARLNTPGRATGRSGRTAT